MNYLIRLRVRQQIRLKKIIVIELILVLLFLILARGFTNYREEYKEMQRIVVGLDNRDKSLPANMLVNNFRNTEHFAGLFAIEELNEEEFGSELKKGTIDAAVTMPPGFAEALYRFENKPVKLITKTSTPIKNAILEETLSGYSRYVKAVDMACYVYNKVLERKEHVPSLIEAYEKAITIELLSATLNRQDYFEQKPIAELNPVNSSEYYAMALPFSILSFISLLGAFQRIKEKNLSVQKRIRVSGISPYKQLLASYIAEGVFVFVIFLPFFCYKFYVDGVLLGFKFLLSVLLAALFFSCLWKFLSQFLRNRESLLVFGIAISFFHALISGAIVPYVLLSGSIKALSEYSINFKLTKYSMGISSLLELLPFALIFFLIFVVDSRREAKLR